MKGGAVDDDAGARISNAGAHARGILDGHDFLGQGNDFVIAGQFGGEIHTQLAAGADQQNARHQPRAPGGGASKMPPVMLMMLWASSSSFIQRML